MTRKWSVLGLKIGVTPQFFDAALRAEAELYP